MISDILLKMKKCWMVPCLLCLVSVLFSGCGYTTHSTLPHDVKTICVELFKNNIAYTNDTNRNVYLPLLEVKVRNAIVSRFLFDGNLKIADADKADLILKGQLLDYQRTALRYTSNDDVQEYRVEITVALELWDARKQEVSWTESGFVGQATYFVSGPTATSEDSAVSEAITDLATRIVERTVENW